MYRIEPELSREYVFSKLSQEYIFEKYLGIPVQFKKLIRSPIRKDENPTCSFTYLGDTLIFTDFAGYFSGDCIKLVMKLYNLKYYDALKKILDDSGEIYIPMTEIKKPDKSKAVIQIKTRQFNNADKDYWTSYGISSETLKKFNVSAVQKLWIDGKVRYAYSHFQMINVAYSYYFGNEEYKIYFPNSKDPRFLSNTQAIQGYKQLPSNGNLIIITKSLKDIMALYEFGINAIALQNEVVVPKKELIQELKGRFLKIYSLYDFDLTGIRTANAIRREYNIKPLFFTNGRFNSVDFKAKDISDYIKKYGFSSTNKLINHLLVEYE